MKIKKKNTTIPINGKIVDTDNVEDKTSNAPSLRLLEEKIQDLIYYKSGDVLEIPKGTIIPGNLTTDATQLQFTYIAPKSFKNIKNVTINDCQLVLRGINGYLDGNGAGVQLKDSSDYSISAKASGNTINFTCTHTTAFDTKNNTPVVIYPISLKVAIE